MYNSPGYFDDSLSQLVFLLKRQIVAFCEGAIMCAITPLLDYIHSFPMQDHVHTIQEQIQALFFWWAYFWL